jgi:opacity protein-like surface antigen
VYGGGAFPQPGEFTDTTGIIADFNLDLKESFTSGIKAGFFFIPWIGLEADVVYAEPDIEPQTVSLVVPGTGVVGLTTGRIGQRLTGGGISLVGRLPLFPRAIGFEPYGGVGVTFLNLELDSLIITGPGVGSVFVPSENDTSVGFQAHVGARYYIIRWLSVGLEYQFRQARFEFKNVGLKETLNLHSVVGVVGFHFRVL